MEGVNEEIVWLAERLKGRYREDEIMAWSIGEFDSHFIREYLRQKRENK